MPASARLTYLSPYTPELHTAGALRVHLDGLIVGTFIDTFAVFDAVVLQGCVALGKDRQLIGGQTAFHRRPERVAPT